LLNVFGISNATSYPRIVFGALKLRSDTLNDGLKFSSSTLSVKVLTFSGQTMFPSSQTISVVSYVNPKRSMDILVQNHSKLPPSKNGHVIIF
jgi:malic enzyme